MNYFYVFLSRDATLALWVAVGQFRLIFTGQWNVLKKCLELFTMSGVKLTLVRRTFSEICMKRHILVLYINGLIYIFQLSI